MTPQMKQRILVKIARLEHEVAALKTVIITDLRASKPLTSAVMAADDPVLAELWDNPQDAAYDKLATR